MSEAREIQNNHSETFPDLEVLQKYLKGECSPEEKARIDAMMEDDPMMADAIEGLGLVKDSAALNASMMRLQIGTHIKVGRSVVKPPRPCRGRARCVV